MSYERDRSWSDVYLPQVRQIVGPRLLEPAPLERDRTEATDLIVLRARDMAIAVRLRRSQYIGQYPGEFTIRHARASGAKTEMAKIIDGWGDWLFYGYAAPEPSRDVAEWLLIDLHKLRRLFIVKPGVLHHPDQISSGIKPNQDGTSFFWFQTRVLPAWILIAQSESLDAVRAA